MVKYPSLSFHSEANCIARKLAILGLEQVWELCRDLSISFRDQTFYIFAHLVHPSWLTMAIYQLLPNTI